jgi:hypothetical protein
MPQGLPETSRWHARALYKQQQQQQLQLQLLLLAMTVHIAHQAINMQHRHGKLLGGNLNRQACNIRAI